MNEKRSFKLNAVNKVFLIFLTVLAFLMFETLFLRLDETVLSENFVNKILGIFVVFIVLLLNKWKWADIGFTKKGFAKYTLTGFVLAASTFTVSYIIEIIALISQGYTVRLDVFTTAFPSLERRKSTKVSGLFFYVFSSTL